MITDCSALKIFPDPQKPNLNRLLRLRLRRLTAISTPLPDIFRSMQSLKELKMYQCSFTSLPASFYELPALELLEIDNWVVV